MAGHGRDALASAERAVRRSEVSAYARAALALSQRRGLFRANRIWMKLWEEHPQVRLYHLAVQAIIFTPFSVMCSALEPGLFSLLVMGIGVVTSGVVAERVLRMWLLRKALSGARSAGVLPPSARLRPPDDARPPAQLGR